jgi:general secretion pathway protein G
MTHYTGMRRKDMQRLQCTGSNQAMTKIKKHNPGTPVRNIKSSGFTLLEILVVVFILSLLAAIVAPRIIGRSDDARLAEAKIQIRNFETALKLFKLDNGFYPDTQQGIQSLVELPTTGRIPRNYREGGYLEQKKIPLDPWDNEYIYISPGINSDFDIISLGADSEEGGEGNDADIKNWELQ